MASNLLLGLGVGIIVGFFGYQSGFLSRGALATVVVVSILAFGWGGWVWGVLPIVFLVSTNLWSRYRADHKAHLSDRFSVGATREWHQVLARVGWSLALVFCHEWGQGDARIYVAFVGALATAAADAWATEVGVLSLRAPRLITTGRIASAGTAGAISALGLVAALAASWLIGFVALLLSALLSGLDKMLLDDTLLWLPIAALVGGAAGCLVDSFLGATAQGMYYCERCQKTTERRVHDCGQEAKQVRGWSWLGNEGVNAVSSVVGAAVAVAAVAWLA